MTWPGLRECTGYLGLGQDSLPLGVRWFSDGLGGAGGRGWVARGATVDETGLKAEKRKRESARSAACGPAAKRKSGGGFWAANRAGCWSKLRAPMNAKTTKVVCHDWHLADA